MKLNELPGWAIAVSLLLIAMVFVHTAFIEDEQFELAGLRFGPVPKAELGLWDAVIAFDKTTKDNAGCPQDWLPFEPAASRVIVGAGPTPNVGMTGKPLTSYPALEDGKEKSVGGDEYVTLERDEIPSHFHGLRVKTTKKQHEGFGLVYRKDGSNVNFVDQVIVISTDEEELNTRDIERSTRGHYNMPPYVALVFCKRKSAP